MLIIGFGNRARHGKDTAAEAVKNFYDQKNALAIKHGQHKAIVRVGVFKFATALYNEANEWLKVFDGKNNWAHATIQEQRKDGTISTVILPDWVVPSPEYEPTPLAPYGKHPKLLQWWGTEYRRAQNKNYWVDKLFASIPANTDIALISDVRFQNEADAITSRGGYNVNVQRLNQDGTMYQSTDRSPNHLSETALDNYNWQFKLTNHEGHQALLEEQSITLVEYLRAAHEEM